MKRLSMVLLAVTLLCNNLSVQGDSTIAVAVIEKSAVQLQLDFLQAHLKRLQRSLQYLESRKDGENFSALKEPVQQQLEIAFDKARELEVTTSEESLARAQLIDSLNKIAAKLNEMEAEENASLVIDKEDSSSLLSIDSTVADPNLLLSSEINSKEGSESLPAVSTPEPAFTSDGTIQLVSLNVHSLPDLSTFVQVLDNKETRHQVHLSDFVDKYGFQILSYHALVDGYTVEDGHEIETIASIDETDKTVKLEAVLEEGERRGRQSFGQRLATQLWINYQARCVDAREGKGSEYRNKKSRECDELKKLIQKMHTKLDN